jgi:hypothetical protein
LTVIVDVAQVRSRVSESTVAAGRIEASTSEQIAVVVPHVHWDREWYAPFEVMRFHLVRFLAEYEIETVSGTLIASEPSPNSERMLPVGTHVQVELDASRSYVLHKP